MGSQNNFEPIVEIQSPATYFTNAATNANEQHLFFVGVSGELIHSWYDGINPDYSVWQSESLTRKYSLPVLPGSDPIALPLWNQTGEGAFELHVFFRGADASLQHLTYDGTSFAHETIAGVPISAPPPGVLSSSSGRALGGLTYTWADSGYVTFTCEQHIFYCGTDGTLQERRWDGSTWSTPPALPGPIAGPPTAQFSAQDYLPGDWLVSVFYTGTDGTLQETVTQDGSNWWTSNTAGQPVGPPSAAQNFGIGVDFRVQQAVFYRNSQGWGRTVWDGVEWSTSEDIPLSMGSDPIATADIITPVTGTPKQRLFWIDGDLAALDEWWMNLSDLSASNDQPPGVPVRLLGVSYVDYSEQYPGPHIFFAASDGSLQQTWGDDGDWHNETIAAYSPPTTYPLPQGCNLPASLIQRLRRNTIRLRT